MFPPNFNKENKDKLKSLEKKYKNQCTINLIDMGNRYKNAPTNKKIPTPTYYRLSLPILLPKLEKIIWLDGDTLTHNDLKEMYEKTWIIYILEVSLIMIIMILIIYQLKMTI